MPVSINRRTLLATSAAAGAAALLPAVASRPAHAADKTSLALDWYPNNSHLGFYLALANGWYDEIGIDLEPYVPSDPTTVLQTVGAGRDAYGITYQTDLLLARAAGVPVVAIAALVQHPLMGVLALADSGITRPADLVGKDVGYPGIPSQDAFMATMMEADGASADDVTLVNVGYNLVPALISGQVPAVMGAFRSHESLVAAQEGYETTFLGLEEWGVPDYYELLLVTSEDRVKNDAEAIAAFVGVTARGYEASAADPQAGLDATAAASPEFDMEIETEGADITIPLWFDDQGVYGAMSAERWDDFAAWMAERGLIPADLDVAAAWTDAFLPAPAGSPEAGA